MTGCSDLFRLLLQGGASLYALDVRCNRTTDIISTIWELAVEEAQRIDRTNEPRSQPIGGIVKFDERVAMTQLALDNDCNIYDADKDFQSSGPLFRIVDNHCINDLNPSRLRDIIQYLTSIGFDLEKSNKFGQTPLHYAASECSPATAIYLRLLIERGARLDAKDDLGLGLLHTVLIRYLYLMDLGNDICPRDRCEYLSFVYGYVLLHDRSWVPDVRDMYWEMSVLLCQEDAENSPLRESVGDHFPSARSTSMCESPPSNPNSGPNTESSRRIGLQGSQIAVEGSLSEVASFFESASDAAFDLEESMLEVNNVHGYVIARDDYGEEYWIRNPVPLLKARVAIKLKILLEAGCDPNVLDDDGLSPSEYAERGKWLRQAWFWALRVTGRTFDAVRDRWIKRSTPT